MKKKSSKDFSIQTGFSSSLFPSIESASPKITSNFTTPKQMKVKKKCELLSTPKLSSISKLLGDSKDNKDHKFQRIFMSVDNNKKKEEEQEKKIRRDFNESFEMEIEDQKPKELVGQGPVTSFYGYYKKLDKIREKNKISLTNDSPFTAILSKTESNFLFPTKMGLVKYVGEENKIKIDNFKYGDKYAPVLSEGIKLLPNISHFLFSGNRFTEKGAKALLSNIGKNTKVIDMAKNHIGAIGCEYIYNIFMSKECRIEELNLEDNKLGDAAIKHLCDGLLENYTLKKLNLSKNYLTNICGDSIKNILLKNQYLKELYLHWNQIKPQGGLKIFQGLLENEGIIVLDISWNSIGGGNPSIVPIIAETLQKNEKIMHLDLSNNYFNLQESKKIAEALENNHTLYGFHFVGNYGYVDSKGFLIVDDNSLKDISEMHLNHRMNGVSFSKRLNHKRGQEFLKDCCWICEGWNEIKFEWIPGISGDADSEPIFLHLDFDSFLGHYMGPIGKGNKFVYERMVPPGKLSFFFTANKIQTAGGNYPVVESVNPVIKNVLIQKKKQDIFIENRNEFDIPDKLDVISSYVAQVQTQPRTKDLVYVAPKRKKEKKPWSFPISIFKDWKKDDEDILKKCFEFDWACSKIPQVVKKEEDIENIKQQLYKIYRFYKETYKYYAAQNPTGEVWSISQQPFTDFIYEIGIIDGKNLELADVFIKLKATLFSEDKNNPRNPERSLVRYQFMEVMVRIAEKRYKSSTISFAEAVEITIRDNLLPIYNKYTVAQKWREEKYWNEQCDDVLKAYKFILENVYSRYSVKKVKPSQKKFMCVEEFYDIFKHANLIDENFVERDVYLAFNQAMMTQVDELSSDRIFQMNFVEFLEAFSRCADKLSLPKIGWMPFSMNKIPAPSETNIVDGNNNNNNRKGSMQRIGSILDIGKDYDIRKVQQLHHKIESAIVNIVSSCTSNSVKEAFEYPKISMFDKAKEDEYEEIDI